MHPKLTDKKNQHYVPKFYLRNFSLHGKGRQIRLYNIANTKFVPAAPLRHEGSSNFYYGRDGIIEDALSKLEGRQSKVVRHILNNGDRIKYGSTDFTELLGFVITTESRNPVKKKMLDDAHNKMNEYFKKLDWAPESDMAGGLPPIDSVRSALNQINRLIDHCKDLHYKIIINKTKVPFITSDNPVVRYNCFLEHRTKMTSISGFGMRGFQMFSPLSETHLLLFYDSQIYYVGSKRSHIVLAEKETDINTLNCLQVINAYSNLYGGERMTENYVSSIAATTTKPTTVHKAKVTVYKQLEKHDEILSTGIESIRANVSLSFLYFTTFAGRYRLESSYASFIRPLSLNSY